MFKYLNRYRLELERVRRIQLFSLKVIKEKLRRYFLNRPRIAESSRYSK